MPTGQSRRGAAPAANGSPGVGEAGVLLKTCENGIVAGCPGSVESRAGRREISTVGRDAGGRQGSLSAAVCGN